MTVKADIGIISGSAPFSPEEFTNQVIAHMGTPFGMPSSNILIGKFSGKNIAFLARHGKDHDLAPHKVPYKANIYALHNLGVKQIISICSVGSINEKIKSGTFLFPDQYIDMTKNRERTFYDTGKINHVSMDIPFCPDLRKTLSETAK